MRETRQGGREVIVVRDVLDTRSSYLIAFGEVRGGVNEIEVDEN